MRHQPPFLAALILLVFTAGWSQRAQGAAQQQGDIPQLVRDAQRIVFLGDSITYGGKYVVYFEAFLAGQRPDNPPTVINVGLPSETVSGLSEEGHAGGRFPRPDLAQRLEGVLQKTQPDLVFACYGINCGIYQPLDEFRFARYQRGIQRLRDAVADGEAQLVLVTPPMYDDQRGRLAFSYNGVMQQYSDWLLSLRSQGVRVIDLNGPMTREVQRRRQSDPEFTFQPDAVHPRDPGHWFMAQQVIQACLPLGRSVADTPEAMLSESRWPPDILKLIEKRMQLLRNSYLTAAGHQRPGIPAGVPLAEAEDQAAVITTEIQKRLANRRADER